VRRIQAFAAGVGDFNPCYFDDTRPGGLVGHPGLVFAFQWNNRPQPARPLSTRAASRYVNSGADVRYARPFRQDEVITCQGEIVAVKQIRPGVFTAQRYTMRDATAATVAELDYAGILRGGVTEGPDRESAPLPPLPQPSPDNTEPVWEAELQIGPEAPHVYTACADIYNPIHTERTVALAAGLPDVILHGSATLTIAAREVIDRCLDGDPTSLARLAGQFRAMVFPGHPITVRCHEDRTGADGGREIFFDVLNHQGEYAVASGLVVSRPA
ncbi:MAG: MaoC/PaaZ C-terminal domain-containing protein, partial [Dehalococcoidia bacterium]